MRLASSPQYGGAICRALFSDALATQL